MSYIIHISQLWPLPRSAENILGCLSLSASWLGFPQRPKEFLLLPFFLLSPGSLACLFPPVRFDLVVARSDSQAAKEQAKQKPWPGWRILLFRNLFSWMENLLTTGLQEKNKKIYIICYHSLMTVGKDKEISHNTQSMEGCLPPQRRLSLALIMGIKRNIWMWGRWQ